MIPGSTELDLFGAPAAEAPPVPLITEQEAAALESQNEPAPEDPLQGALFDLEELDWWKEHWQDMPEFSQEDLTPWQSIYVHFTCRADRDAFAKLVGQKITDDARRTRSIWYPEAEIGRMMNKRFICES